MSGKPHHPGVTEILDSLRNIDKLQEKIVILEGQVKELADLRAARTQLARRVEALLREMDMASPGNFGWETRVAWFLAQFRKEAETRRCAFCRGQIAVDDLKPIYEGARLLSWQCFDYDACAGRALDAKLVIPPK